VIRSILVPLDGSDFGEQALPLAVAIARRAGAVVHVVHVHIPRAAACAETVTPMENNLDPMGKEQEKAYLERVANWWRTRGSVPVLAHLLEGPVAEAILEFVADSEIDLVVLTTHGRGAFSRFWQGSVADELVRLLATPLLLVRPMKEGLDPGDCPTPRHMLIPLDGTELAEQALTPATELGRLMQADYTLLRVVPPMPAAGFDHAGVAVGCSPPPPEENPAREAREYLDRVASRLRGEGLRVSTAVAIGEPPDHAILEEARDHGADMIAMETHGRGGLARLLLGSVADKVSRGAPLPVLVHRLPIR
jgi:nucleotide-binding universal stress UspA family protein